MNTQSAQSHDTIPRMFLTVIEAAQRLGVSKEWLYERTRKRSIPHRRLGRLVRFSEDDLKAIEEAAATGRLQ